MSIRQQKWSAPRGAVPERIGNRVEIGWTAATLFVFVFVFWFAAALDTDQFEIPADAMEIHVVAKQWMWKLEHPNGAREINALHVPMGVPVRLVMTSQDVIHSFFIPSLGVQRYAIPGRTIETWVRVDKAGTYYGQCNQICGTNHSAMPIAVRALPESEFQAWIEDAKTKFAEGATSFPVGGPTRLAATTGQSQ